MTKINSDTLQAMSYIKNLSRRDFLKLSSVAASIVAVSSVISPLSVFAAIPDGIKHMSESELAVFNRLMEVSLPTQGTKLVPLKDIPVLLTLDAALLATMEPHILTGLKGGIAYFNDGPLEKYKKRFVELNDEEACSFCDAWADSNEIPQRALVMGLKKLVGLAYWANPPTWAPLGYDGPVSKRWGLKSQGNAPMPKG